ncbi:sigma-E factor negative regulatory protein [Lysobacter silvisoli]|uniref:Anti sigma-E protein RseA N-terminal domain-containing protein n=1 Tax=Lysobacter silvisoli TaxID=2293254 RepID=A0A371K1Z3_9GAMM|nr:sigma-E factor negative regulatory protein [Lysobacter silvisoli]RDZ27949.1 hypothetical protein DX914_01990 [Lysobacter silvisoli]
MTSNQAPNNGSNVQPTDREALSALFDGELDGDAARFALKRLSHDAQWRQACESWQLCGDVLRGQAATLAAPGFAQRVAAAVAAESTVLQAAASEPAAPAPRRRWLGGAALAASVAVVALFVARPFSGNTPDAAAPQTQVASAETAAPAAAPAEPTAPAETAAVLGAAVAVADVPRRVAERRSTRSQNQRAALRRQTQTAAAAPPLEAVAAVNGAVAGSTANPFRPQHVEPAATRPWPRAVLPNYPATGGYTASYGSSTSSASSPSFYPFEPKAADANPSPPPADSEARMPQP